MWPALTSARHVATQFKYTGRIEDYINLRLGGWLRSIPAQSPIQVVMCYVLRQNVLCTGVIH